MITRLKLKPGQKGTKALMEKYGDALVCVRYRYDDETRTRLKTVELIVEKKKLPSAGKNANKEELVAVRISYGERDMALLAKKLGGWWDPDVRLWYVPGEKVKGTELEKHIILNAKLKKDGK